MTIAHKLLGFDKVSEEIVHEFYIPEELIPRAYSLVGAPKDYWNYPFSYPLSTELLPNLLSLARSIVPNEYDWFVEATSEEGGEA